MDRTTDHPMELPAVVPAPFQPEEGQLEQAQPTEIPRQLEQEASPCHAKRI